MADESVATGGTAPSPRAHVARGVHTRVEHESGRWVVYLAVIFDDGVVRHRISDHHTERLARIAAGWIERAADRDIDTPGTTRARPHPDPPGGSGP